MAMLGWRVMLLCALFGVARSYSSPFVRTGLAARNASPSSLSRLAFPTLRGGHSDWPSTLHATAAGQAASEPITKDAAQTQRSYIQELSSGAKARSAIPGLAVPEVEDQTPRNALSSESKVLIVGASRGIGLEFVKQVLAKGASVVATHRGSEPPAALAELQSEVGAARLALLELDVASAPSVQAAAEAYRGSADFAPLTHIIHNAGVYGPRVSLDGEARYGRPAGAAVTPQDMMEVFSVNCVGPLVVVQAFSPLLLPPAPDHPERTGVIALLTSKVGSVDDNTSGGAYAYRASKAALNVVAKSLLCDLHGKANLVLLHPGYVRTDMTGGEGLISAPESVAGLLRAVEATDKDKEFRFVDYKACLIPW